MRFVYWGFTLFSVAACSSTQFRSPQQADGPRVFGVDVKSTAQLWIKGCSGSAVLKNAKGARLDLIREARTGECFVRSTWLSPATYNLQLSGDKRFAKPVQMALHFRNPDWNAGSGSRVEDAAVLEPGKSVRVSLEPGAGKAGSWVKIAGQNASVTLNLTASGKGDVKAYVYQKLESDGTDHRLLIGSVVAGGRRKFRLQKEDLLVRIAATDFSGSVNATLSRQDATLKKTLSIPVIDCYPTRQGSLVLLQAVEGLKANGEVSVFGRKKGGGQVALGICTVTALSQEQASCKMDREVPGGIVSYRAEIAAEG